VSASPALTGGSTGDHSLAAEPVVLTGALVGYARVSTKDQRLDRQRLALEAAGCMRIFADKKSGKNVEREELWKALDYMRPGDTLVVPSLDRLAHSLQDLIAIVADLRKRGIGLRSLKEALDTTTAGGRLVFHVFAALAEFIRELIIEGTGPGRRPRPRPAPRTAPGDEPGADPPRPRPAHPTRREHRLHRPAAGGQPLHHLQVRARAEDRRRPPSHRGPRGTRRAHRRWLIHDVVRSDFVFVVIGGIGVAQLADRAGARSGNTKL
jgi:hypothetical protein